MTPHSAGYVWDGNKLAHVVVAERALGKELPLGAQVHHFNGVRSDNRNDNLVICQDAAYHALLHMRQKAMEACGDPSKRKCGYCKVWDEPEKMTCRRSKKQGDEYRHRECHAKWMREWNARRIRK
jgi:predicted NUDIX family phosphoesterase